VDAVAGMNPHGNEEGIIDAFDVYLTNMYADYYNGISFKFEQAVAASDPENLDFARSLLTCAGHVCAFHTFGGIYRSAAWKAAIAPMVENELDKVRGIVGVVNALGWGVWEIRKLDEKRLVLRVKNSYESTGYLKAFPKSKNSECYLIQGGAAGLMNLFLSGPNIDERGTAAGLFVSEETKCRCRGDSYCEFEVTRRK
jgi:predicted hydrocarbon binding protein